MSIDLPTTSSRVRLDELHPRFIHRLTAFFDDPLIKGRVSIVSGVRTLAQQQSLYDRYRAGKGNLAANPARVFGGGFRGSWHMAQPAMENYGYAVDLRCLGGIEKWQINDVARQYGVVPTIQAKEWWHHQCYGRTPVGAWGWFDAPALKGDKEDVVLVKAKHPLAEIAAAIERARGQVLRIGSRGEAVKFLQICLENHGISTTSSRRATRGGRGVDGIFGRGTQEAVMRFQRDELLHPDGVVGPRTWGELLG